VLADDHQIVREGLRMLLEREGFEIAAEAVNGSEAVRLVEEIQPDVAILDLMMPILNGLEAGREIRRRCPRTEVVLLTVNTDEYHVAEALRAGVHGYVVKTQASKELVHAIRAVRAGQSYLSPTVSSFVVSGYLSGAQAPVHPLTPRERQVLQLVAEGKTSKEVAEVMSISAKTVESYRSRLIEKLGVRDTVGLVKYAIRHGMVQA
jgi:DNA-binding NarL/FixJ family response regulator